MSLTTGEMSAADLAAVVGNSNGNGDGFGGTGNGWWIILLFLCLFGNGGWGGNNGGGNMGGGNGSNGFGLYPWMNQAEITSDGFRDQMINNNITSIRDSISDLSTQLCNCCCDMRQTVSNGFAQAEIANNARQIADMQQMFNLSTQFSDCCCENRLANCQTQNIIQSEASATRFADANNTRDIIQSQTSGIQTVMDKLCQLELDAKNDRINDLERQLTMANLAASQIDQTARILAGQTAEVDALYERLNNCPVGTVPVYGRQPIFTCPNNNNGCGCGCGNNF